jgi:hypothetical protein
MHFSNRKWDECSDFEGVMHKNVDDLDKLVEAKVRSRSDFYNDIFSTYDFQVMKENGRPRYDLSYVEDLLDDPQAYIQPFPPSAIAIPEYDEGGAMNDLRSFLDQQAKHMIFVEGEYDPWRFAAFDTELNSELVGVMISQGNHFSNLDDLKNSENQVEKAQFETVVEIFREWTGQTLR